MSSKAVKEQLFVSNDNKEVDVGSCRERKGTEEDEAEYEKEECVSVSVSVSVTNQLFLKPIDNTRNLDKEVVLRRIRHRKRVNKVRSVVGSILSSPFTSTHNTDTGNDASVQRKRWVDDAFAAL